MAIRLGSVLRGLCPNCHQGRFVTSLVGTNRRCPECGYDFHPEPGFYLGSMVVTSVIASAIAIPTIILLKILGQDISIILAAALGEYLILGPILLLYSRVLWLHAEHAMTHRLDGERRKPGT